MTKIIAANIQYVGISLLCVMGLAAHASAQSSATVGNSHFSGFFGVGQAAVTSAENGKGSATEGPGSFGFAVDHFWHDSYFILVEHLRSYGNGSTSVGLTGVGAKYYPWLSPRHYHHVAGESIPKSTMSYDGWMYYFGASTGIAQASVPASKSNSVQIAVSFYTAVKAGVDFPLNRNWSAKCELDYAISYFGSGAIQQSSLMAGVAYAL